MRILNYEPQGVEFKLGQLDQFSVEGIWANLNLELLYLTSDDDERFSIQVFSGHNVTFSWSTRYCIC